LAFVILVMSRLRAFGIEGEVLWQEDCGQEFGGDNPRKLEKLDKDYYRPLGTGLKRCPKGGEEISRESGKKPWDR